MGPAGTPRIQHMPHLAMQAVVACQSCRAGCAVGSQPFHSYPQIPQACTRQDPSRPIRCSTSLLRLRLAHRSPPCGTWSCCSPSLSIARLYRPLLSILSCCPYRPLLSISCCPYRPLLSILPCCPYCPLLPSRSWVTTSSARVCFECRIHYCTLSFLSSLLSPDAALVLWGVLPLARDRLHKVSARTLGRLHQLTRARRSRLPDGLYSIPPRLGPGSSCSLPTRPLAPHASLSQRSAAAHRRCP